MKHILVVSEKNEAVDKIKSSFKQNCIIEKVERIDTLLKNPQEIPYDLVFIDIDTFSGASGEIDFREMLHALRHRYPDIEPVFMSSKGPFDNKSKAGAGNNVTDPVKPIETIHSAGCNDEQAMVRSIRDYRQEEFWQSGDMEIIRTRNPVMKKVYDQIRSVAPTKTTVLLYGETGTGKGVLANLIHRNSHREKDQFIGVHCGAIPDTLLESELFGHEKGAFTGAFKRKPGKFEIAGKGTLFLDEISTITASAQIKLLQVLQDGTFSRVGGEEILKTDARFIAATNMDLKKMCDTGLFRKDLYYRLNVFPIEIPPLRERTEDIPLLVETFIKRLNIIMQKRIQNLHPDIIDAMKTYSWPGNIRELENLMERAFILETASMLTPESFPAELFTGVKKSAVLRVNTSLTLAESRRQVVDEFERQFIKEILAKNKGRINKSSEEAGISTRQFHKLMTRHGIEKEDYKS